MLSILYILSISSTLSALSTLSILSTLSALQSIEALSSSSLFALLASLRLSLRPAQNDAVPQCYVMGAGMCLTEQQVHSQVDGRLVGAHHPRVRLLFLLLNVAAAARHFFFGGTSLVLPTPLQSRLLGLLSSTPLRHTEIL